MKTVIRRIRKRVIKIDYDQTIDNSKFPGVGNPIPGALETIKELMGKYTLILDTCRHDESLQEAITYLESKDIHFDYICENSDGLIMKYGNTRKIAADICIDDKNLFTPLNENKCVNWFAVRDELVSRGLL